MEPGAAPAGGGRNVPPAPGRCRGLRPGTLRSPARSWLTAGRQSCPRPATRGHRKWWPPLAKPQGKVKRPVRKRGPAPKENVAMARREAPHLPPRRCAHDSMTRRSARHPLDLFGGRKKDYGVPGAAKNTGEGACLFVVPVRAEGANPESRDIRNAHLDSGFAPS